MGKIITYKKANSILGGGVSIDSNSRCLTKELLVSSFANVDDTKLFKYTNNQLVSEEDVFKKEDGDITDGLIFCVPFTDGTPRDIISNVLPTAGYTKDSNGHLFTKGNKYNVTWSVPQSTGTFSIMYKFVSKGSERSFLFGHDGYFNTIPAYQSDGANGFGIWSNSANNVKLGGGNRQWPKGASTTVSGEWTDDYHVATFTYDISKAVLDRPYIYTDINFDAFNMYKDGVLCPRYNGHNLLLTGNSAILNYITLSGGVYQGGANVPREYTTSYVKDARIYNRCLSPEEVKKLAEYCLAK